MRWSKLRKLTEDSFAESVRGRVTVHSTAYSFSGCRCGRGWISLEGRDIADMNTLLQWPNFQSRDWPADEWGHPQLTSEHRCEGRLVEPGEFTRYDLHEACWAYVHSNPHASLRSTNALVRALAVLNAKAGRRSLALLFETETHPLVRRLLAYRFERAGWALPGRREPWAALA